MSGHLLFLQMSSSSSSNINPTAQTNLPAPSPTSSGLAADLTLADLKRLFDGHRIEMGKLKEDLARTQDALTKAEAKQANTEQQLELTKLAIVEAVARTSDVSAHRKLLRQQQHELELGKADEAAHTQYVSLVWKWLTLGGRVMRPPPYEEEDLPSYSQVNH